MNAVVHSQASIVVQPIVLPRAKWKTIRHPIRGTGFEPIKGTWYAHMIKQGLGPSTVLPMIACPSCGTVLYLSHTSPTATILSKMMGTRVPVVHAVSIEGRVKVHSPGQGEGDVRCGATNCSFHREVYLDKWDRLRPLYCTAYLEGNDINVKFAFSHAASQKEARFHLGAGRYHVIAVGRAVGFLFDEKTRKFEVV